MVALRLLFFYALYLPFYGVFLLRCMGWVSFLVKSDIGGILGVWRYFRFFCCWRSGLVVVWCGGLVLR